MLVTSVSPGVAAVWCRTPVTVPAALTVSVWVPGVPRSSLVVLLLQAGLADQVDAGEAGHRQVALLDLLRGDGLQVPEHLGRVRG